MGEGVMGMREKLIELIADCTTECYSIPCNECDYFDKPSCASQWKADHLIANGVTIVTDTNAGCKWIPVTEMLPEVVDSYLVVVKYKYDYEKEYSYDTDVATYNPYEPAYIDDCWNTYNDWDEGQQYIHVTHWMPLPEPPKE